MKFFGNDFLLLFATVKIFKDVRIILFNILRSLFNSIVIINPYIRYYDFDN